VQTIKAIDIPPVRVLGRQVTAWKDWHTAHEYRQVMHEDDVAKMLSRFGGSGVAGMSAEDAYKAQAPLFKALGNPIPAPIMGELGVRAADFWSNRGINKQHTEAVAYDIPVGLVIAATLVSFASRGHVIERCEQADDGCVLVARMRSSLWAHGGDITVGIERIDDLTHVEAAASAKGQFFDWGHTRRSIDDLTEDVVNFVSLMP